MDTAIVMPIDHQEHSSNVVLEHVAVDMPVVAAEADVDCEMGIAVATAVVDAPPVDESEEQNKGEGDVDDDDGKVCRVCHLSVVYSGEQSEESTMMEWMELGCDCKSDLAIAHRRCAETWFKIRGNRNCEICGRVVENVMGLEECYNFCLRSEERSESLINSDVIGGEERRFWHHRPICNFVLAFIVVILLLPWLFRIRLF